MSDLRKGSYRGTDEAVQRWSKTDYPEASVKMFEELYRKKRRVEKMPATWVIDLIQKATPSLTNTQNLVQRIMTRFQLRSPCTILLEHVLRFCEEGQTSNPTKAEYLSSLRGVARNLQLPWANDPIVAQTIRALKTLSAGGQGGAFPLSLPTFWILRHEMNPIQALIILMGLMAGMRMDELEKIHRSSISVLPADQEGYKFVLIVPVLPQFRSKAAKIQPSALRFMDLVLLDDKEVLLLMNTCNRQSGLLMEKKERRIITSKLKGLGLSDHSLKKGAGEILATLAAEGTISAKAVAVILKHSDPATTFSSTTTRYMTSPASKLNLLRASGVTAAITLMRAAILTSRPTIGSQQ
jgi:integrase